MSMSLIIVSDLVRIEDRRVFQSHINFAFGLGSASGAALGGRLCDILGWRWPFGAQVPFLAICFGKQQSLPCYSVVLATCKITSILCLRWTSLAISTLNVHLSTRVWPAKANSVLPVLGAMFTPSNLGPMPINAGEGSAWIALKNFDSLDLFPSS